MTTRESGPRPRRLAAAWEQYERYVLPSKAGQIQRTESRRAFYAGARAIMALMLNGVSDSPEVELEDIDLMENLDAELEAFSRDVQGGRA